VSRWWGDVVRWCSGVPGRAKNAIRGRRRLGAAMVQWLSPTGLASTGYSLYLAGVFGRYADKRQVVGLLGEPGPLAFPQLEGLDEIWFDFVADTGDGWASTLTVASALSEPQDANGEATEVGDLLVFGGDQVYPSADAGRYRERLLTPYFFASRHLGTMRPAVAIPGNHDWYDGASSFLSVLAFGGDVGAWHLPQTRTYFAVPLAARWWLIGIDVGLADELDRGQLEYFRNLTAKHGGPIACGDYVILVTARPTWSEKTLTGDHRLRYHADPIDLQLFEREIVDGWGCELPLVLSGDLHHYSRYQFKASRTHRVTAGGGGAYLFPTHGLADSIRWNGGNSADVTGALVTRYPSKPESERLRKGIKWSAFNNPRFLLLVAILHLVVASQVMGSIHAPAGSSIGNPPSQLEALAGAPITVFLSGMFTRPLAGFLVVLLFTGLLLFADRVSKPRRLAITSLHWAAHVVCLTFAMASAAWVVCRVLSISTGREPSWLTKASAIIFIGIAVAGTGAVLGGLVFGWYLHICERNEMHANDAFAAMAIAGHKNFVRMRLRPNESLRLFAFAVPHVGADNPRIRELSVSRVKLPTPDVELIEAVDVWSAVDESAR
jgi:hypothetical protein